MLNTLPIVNLILLARIAVPFVLRWMPSELILSLWHRRISESLYSSSSRALAALSLAVVSSRCSGGSGAATLVLGNTFFCGQSHRHM
jgi:hypothetical protein